MKIAQNIAVIAAERLHQDQCGRSAASKFDVKLYLTLKYIKN